jgi:hypothetical protein
MRTLARLGLSALALGLALLATPAAAGGLVEVSAGSGFRFSPSPIERIPTNVMLTGGYAFTDMLKLELGVAGNLADVKGSKFDLDFRPMVVISPPLMPVYARGILGVGGILEKPRHLVYGGALGLSLGALGVGAFVEAGALSRRVDWPNSSGTGTTKKDIWMAEGRIGIYFK